MTGIIAGGVFSSLVSLSPLSAGKRKKRAAREERPLRWTETSMRVNFGVVILGAALRDSELDTAAHPEHVEIVEIDWDVLQLASGRE